MSRAILAGLCVWALGSSNLLLAQVKLEQKYAPNTQAATNETFQLNAKVKVADQNVEIAANSRLAYLAEFPPPADNLVPIKVTVTAAALSTTAAGQSYMYDSALAAPPKSDNPEFDQQVEVLQALINHPLTYQLAADGKVARVEGAQAIISQAPADATKALQERLAEQRLKDEFEQQVRLLPDTPVKSGDIWQRIEQIPIQGGTTLAIDRTYEYVGTVSQNGQQVDRIKVTDTAVRIMLGNNDIGLTLKEADLKVASSEGTMYFNRELGAIVERAVTTRVTGKVTLLANGNDLPIDLDITFTQSRLRQK